MQMISSRIVHPSTDTVRPAINEHIPDIFTIICCNDGFQLALDHNTIKILLRVCKRARPLLSSKVPRFHRWCQSMELLNPDGQMRIGLTPSDQIAISLHCYEHDTADRSWLVAQAEHGNAAASYFLARIVQVETQLATYQSQPNAFHQQILQYLKRAVEYDHPMAQFHLAECYRNGLGTNQDHTKAAGLYRSLAERGMPQAQIAFGRCYESGEGVDQGFDSAIEWYSKATDQGNEDGRLHTVFLQAWFSFIGRGVEQSDADAFNHWQEVSTKSTDPILKPIATFMVGWMHYLGRGTVQDKQKGTKIIRDNESDEFKLGETECLASYNWETNTDSRPPSRKFFELCELGYSRNWLCRHLVAVCLFLGFGTTKDRKEAVGIFGQLANEGHSDSQLWIGECYYGSGGVSKGNEKAFEWFSKSANQGNSYGQWRVAFCYHFGQGVAEDVTEAAEWYRKSAEQGNRYGQHWLSHCYQYGRGVPKNIDTALYWRRKSAEQGFQSAINNLKELGQWP
ncbi:uncharacterized protein BJ171DRAFT_119037 [Polychytrium aggregatum]|uniref:uncharacterized protein n=1 Tax=Polychytrium aggregatum TaxID=110093 RepID=UPI0022FEF4F5|nr:uncharacterized protein BJ171DRAFT_119037 [Polychytrium aggregatum]KAI9209515.1 hypothetical protein BJ171DRAFT_119037 [Polychytrium aggregatum]